MIKAHLAAAPSFFGSASPLGFEHRALCGERIAGKIGAAWHEDICPKCLQERDVPPARRPFYVILVTS